jgi:hypothetical protein
MAAALLLALTRNRYPSMQPHLSEEAQSPRDRPACAQRLGITITQMGVQGVLRRHAVKESRKSLNHEDSAVKDGVCAPGALPR